MLRFGFIIFLSCWLTTAFAQTDTRTQTFDETFRTIQTKVDGDDLSLPVIDMGSNQVLQISFDRIATERDYLRYTLVHCNRDWQPSGLVDSEFLDGFNEAEVNDYQFSRGTHTHYVHYTITLPNEEVRFRISGNYLLKVYPEYEPDNTLLQVRFYVNEASMKLTASVSSRTDIDYDDRHQQLTIVADPDRVDVRDYWRDLSIVVSQNNRADDVRLAATPTRVDGRKAHFDHQKGLIFPAGNEYRRMEVTSTQYPTMGVEHVGSYAGIYAFELHPDHPRSHSQYLYDQTQKGRFRIREISTDSPDTEADYVAVFFALESPELTDGDIFIDGDMTCRNFGPESRMVYNRASGRYELMMILKQGAYNYQYLYVPHNSTIGSTSVVEGDFAPTQNEYFVRLYHRGPGERFDRLTAAGRVNAY